MDVRNQRFSSFLTTVEVAVERYPLMLQTYPMHWDQSIETPPKITEKLDNIFSYIKFYKQCHIETHQSTVQSWARCQAFCQYPYTFSFFKELLITYIHAHCEWQWKKFDNQSQWKWPVLPRNWTQVARLTVQHSTSWANQAILQLQVHKSKNQIRKTYKY